MQTSKRGNLVCYYAASKFDDQYYTIKKRKIGDLNELENKREQILLH